MILSPGGGLVFSCPRSFFLSLLSHFITSFCDELLKKKAKPYSPYVFPNVLIIFFISFIYAQTAKGTNLPLYNY